MDSAGLASLLTVSPGFGVCSVALRSLLELSPLFSGARQTQKRRDLGLEHVTRRALPCLNPRAWRHPSAGPAAANQLPPTTPPSATAPQTAPRRSSSRRLSGSAPSPVPITGLSGRDAASLAPGGKDGRTKRAEQDGPPMQSWLPGSPCQTLLTSHIRRATGPQKRPLIWFGEDAMDRPPPAPRSLRKRAAAVGSASHAYGTTLGDLQVSAPLFSPLLSGVGAERVAFGEALNV